MDKIKDQLPQIGASKVIRRIVSKFVDQNLDKAPSEEDLDTLAATMEDQP